MHRRQTQMQLTENDKPKGKHKCCGQCESRKRCDRNRTRTAASQQKRSKRKTTYASDNDLRSIISIPLVVFCSPPSIPLRPSGGQ
ncbi:membrane protein [Anopheles sinensis]|uniref:Membrane protein n=1 Tax=Anopheles sinensis TaxID=74873 RepID=A0A084WTL0_ANOSI|nr:membrane protein [Anopheles sinensis]